MLAKGQGARSSDASRVFAVTQFAIRRDRDGLEEVADMPEIMNEQFRALPVWRCGVALVLAEVGRPIEAQQELNFLAADHFVAIQRDMAWLCCTAMLAETAAHLGDLPRATSLYDLMLPYGERVIVAGYGFGCWGSLSRHLGVLATTLSRWEQAAQHFDRALQVDERIGARLCHARTQIDYAAMLLLRRQDGDLEHAESLTRQALETSRECGAHRLADRAQSLLSTAVGARDDREPIRNPAPAAPRSIFRLEGDSWTVVYGGVMQRLGNSKGLRCIHHLLAHPGREFHVLDLVELLRGSQKPVASSFSPAAPGSGDPQRSASASEQARINVTKLISAAIRKVRANDLELARYLAMTIQTGTYCSHAPDPARPLHWEL
jgi:hypothetical protein